MYDLSSEDLYDLEDGEEVSIFSDCFAIDGQVTVRTGKLLTILNPQQLPHAGCTATMLIATHHHRRVLIRIKLAQAQETLRFYIIPQQ